MNQLIDYISPTDPELLKAIEEAQKSLDRFVVAFKSPRPMQTSFFIKILDTENRDGEFVWVDVIRMKEDSFEGTIDVEEIARRRHVIVERPQVVDWFYTDNNWLEGGFTIRVLANRQPEHLRYDYEQSLPFMIGPVRRDSLEHQFMDAIGHRELERVAAFVKSSPTFVKKRFPYIRVGFGSKSIDSITPFQYAVAVSSPEIIELLHKAGADVNASDERGHNCLYSAVLRQDVAIVKKLLDWGANPNVGIDIDDSYPIDYAVGRESNEIIAILIQGGTDLEHKTKNKETPMCFAHFPAAVDLLYQAGVTLDAQDKNGDTALHRRIQQGNAEVARRLIELGARLDIRNREGKTPIDEAKTASDLGPGFVEEIRRIAVARNQMGEDPMIREATVNAKKSLDRFIQTLRNRKPMQDSFSVRVLDQRNSDEYVWVKVDAIDGQIFRGKMDTAEGIGCKVLSIDPCEIVDWYFVDNNWLEGGYSIRLSADRKPRREREAFEESLPYIIGPLHRDSIEHQLMDAIGHQDLEIVKGILKVRPRIVKEALSYAFVSPDYKTVERMTPFQYAVKCSSLQMIELLRESGSNINAQSDMGSSCLWTAVKRNETAIVERLLSWGADPNLSDDLDAFTPLFTAATLESPDIALLLIGAGADIHHKLKNLETPMNYAQTPEMVDILHMAGLPLSNQNRYGNTPLHSVIYGQRKETVRRLVELGARLDLRNEDGDTALELAERESLFDHEFLEELKQIELRKK